MVDMLQLSIIWGVKEIVVQNCLNKLYYKLKHHILAHRNAIMMSMHVSYCILQASILMAMMHFYFGEKPSLPATSFFVLIYHLPTPFHQ